MEVNYRGDLVAPSGYSRSIRSMMRALIEVGVDVHGDHNPHDKTVLEFEEDPFWKDHMERVVSSRRVCPIKIWHETPEFYEPDPTQYNIAYLLWETSRIIDYDLNGNPRYNWVKQLNRMDEIWTSAEFCAQVYRECGVKVPIYVFPPPIDLEAYSPKGEKYNFVAGNREIENKMIFLSVFQFTKRKNPHDLLVAWSAEFAHQDDVALVIKTYGSDFKDNSKLRDFVFGLRQSCRIPDMKPNVHLILELIPDEDMDELYRMCDVFVLPSYGEGFGMPCQEAMACGRPVIYTNASAMPEFCLGWPVKCDPEPVYGMLNIPWYSAAQDWWKVRPADLRRALRDAYDEWKNKKQAFETRKAAAREQIEELHSYEVVGQGMRKRLEEITWRIKDGTSRPELVAWGALRQADELSDPPSSTV